MASTPEGKVKDGVRKILKEWGIWYYQPVQNGMGQVGIPDFVCCWQGKFLAIETKAPGKLSHVTPNQIRVLAEIEHSGGLSFVVDDPNQLRKILDSISPRNGVSP
jgi:hypothetical protein